MQQFPPPGIAGFTELPKFPKRTIVDAAQGIVQGCIAHSVEQRKKEKPYERMDRFHESLRGETLLKPRGNTTRRWLRLRQKAST
jgi:hypothetical protein